MRTIESDGKYECSNMETLLNIIIAQNNRILALEEKIESLIPKDIPIQSTQPIQELDIGQELDKYTEHLPNGIYHPINDIEEYIESNSCIYHNIYFNIYSEEYKDKKSSELILSDRWLIILSFIDKMDFNLSKRTSYFQFLDGQEFENALFDKKFIMIKKHLEKTFIAIDLLTTKNCINEIIYRINNLKK